VTGFTRINQELCCDGASLAAIADAVGTPVYVYSAGLVRTRYRELDRAFGAYPHAIHYALKANSTLALARVLRDAGSGVDANSLWEIDVARRAGFAPGDVVFTGVGKTAVELECAVSLGVKAINVESAGELARVEAIANRLGRVARVAVRLNPDIDANSHPHISTGLRVNKFGVPFEEAGALFASLSSRPSLALVAVHVHVGSQIVTLDPLRSAAAHAATAAHQLRSRGLPIEYVDVGGGLGISYDGHEVVSPSEYVATIVAEVSRTSLPVVIEPGRAIVGPAGVLLARVVDLKRRDGSSEFAVLDAGMTELLRPALYGAFHRIERVAADGAPERRYELVGPVCESSDVVGHDRLLGRLAVDDLLAVLDAGAYGSVMASNYNRRPLPAEVLVDGGEWRVVRRRQTVDDMLALES
jgi:diaminopimelate decarboxylase